MAKNPIWKSAPIGGPESGLVRGGAGTALVGDPRRVAKMIPGIADLGIETFILSGYPHLEEAYRVAEWLFLELSLPAGSLYSRRRREPVRGNCGQSSSSAKERIRNEHQNHQASCNANFTFSSLRWSPALLIVLWQLFSSIGWISYRTLPAPLR